MFSLVPNTPFTRMARDFPRMATSLIWVAIWTLGDDYPLLCAVLGCVVWCRVFDVTLYMMLWILIRYSMFLYMMLIVYLYLMIYVLSYCLAPFWWYIYTYFDHFMIVPCCFRPPYGFFRLVGPLCRIALMFLSPYDAYCFMFRPLRCLWSAVLALVALTCCFWLLWCLWPAVNALEVPLVSIWPPCGFTRLVWPPVHFVRLVWPLCGFVLLFWPPCGFVMLVWPWLLCGFVLLVWPFCGFILLVWLPFGAFALLYLAHMMLTFCCLGPGVFDLLSRPLRCLCLLFHPLVALPYWFGPFRGLILLVWPFCGFTLLVWPLWRFTQLVWSLFWLSPDIFGPFEAVPWFF